MDSGGLFIGFRKGNKDSIGSWARIDLYILVAKSGFFLLPHEKLCEVELKDNLFGRGKVSKQA